MTMFTVLTTLALAFFLAHVYLLFTSFGKLGYQKTKYLWSHLTLWICGVILCLITVFYAGKNVSVIADVFDTPAKQILPVGVVLVLSALAHTIVKTLVMPKYATR